MIITKEEMLKIAEAAITKYLDYKKVEYLNSVDKHAEDYLKETKYELNEQYFENDFQEWLFG
jgi:hypothetical protein